MALIARGQITVSTVSNGANSINIYIRSQFQPSNPTGTTPVGWSANASTFDSSYWTLWVSSATKNADGSLTNSWNKPIPVELHDSNALGRFPFVVGTGAQSPYYPYSSTNNIREQGLNPFGVNDVLWRGKSQISSGWCGGFSLTSSRYVPVDNSKRYRFSCWIKRNTWSEGLVYFGVHGAVENGVSWSSNSNYYLHYIPTTTQLEVDKWYFVVGYIYPSVHSDAKVDVRSGIYDPTTGNRIIASPYFCRQKAGVKSLGFRISQYRCTTTNPEIHFWQPRIDLCDGREVSIEELVKKNPITSTVNISGESVFKFTSEATIPVKTSLSFTATISSGLISYQWQYYTGSYWATISGATRSSLSLAYNYSAWGSRSTLPIRCISALAGKVYFSNEITVTKVYDGAVGPAGEDSNMLDWVEDWDTSKTVINSNSVITPKIFAGVKNANNTVTGIALGHFSLTTRNTSGVLVTEMIDGIYGFRDGYKTFSVDSEGSAQLGRGSQSIKYNAVSGRVEFGSAVALAWVGATYIDANGIFTGRLSADSIKAITLNATQITAGTINASRIDVNSLKAVLITANNINALTLNATKGKIGDWNINSDAIYRGTKVNISGRYTGASGAITIGSTGIRGYKWRLDSTGAGAIAGGNISWASNGVVTFSSAVSLNWSAPISDIEDALGGDSFPKLTKITSTGIYTGTLTASQITAGTINADRIGVGTITASKLNVASIKADIINVGYINGLTCSFTKGTIGGWRIGTNMLYNSNLRLDNANRRVVVFGTSSSSTTGHRVQLYYSSAASFGFYATNSAGACIAQIGSTNQISGWLINTNYIRKNSVYLGADGSIYNGNKWRFNNDGSGSIASGNISWNSGGAITFSSAVSLNWKNDIEAAKTTNYGYRYYKQIVINGESDKYYPVVFKGGDQTIKRDILIRRSYHEQAPSDWNTSTHKGGLIALIKTNFGGWGGASYSWDIYELSESYCRMFAGAALIGNSCMFGVFLRGGGSTGAIYHLYSDQPIESSSYSPAPIPHAPQIAYNSDLMFKSGNYTANAPAPRTLTASVEEEIRRKKFINLAQGNDSTLTQHPLTYIGSTGIYTGTLTALQVNAVAISANSITTGTLSANRIAAGSITSTKLDANSIKANIINTSYINGLSCSFTKGTIGGWRIGTYDMTIGSLGSVGSTPIQLRTTASGSGYWYAGAYKPYGISLLWYRSSNAGHIVFGQIAASGSSVKTGFMGLQMMSWDGYEYFCLSANTLRSGSKEVYNRIAGWAFDRTRIWKNSVSLGADGSITNGTKWQLNNDGSGRLANGNITWNSSGTISFSSSVSLNWTNAATNALNAAKSYADTKSDAAKELASAMASGRMIYRDPTFYNGSNSISVYNNSGNGTVTVSRTYNSTAPNDSKYVLRVRNSGTSSPGCGGFYFGTTCSYRKIFITRIIAKIPVGRSIVFASNSMGTGGSQKWLTDTNGIGDWCEYISKVTCGTSSFSSTNFFYITGASSLTWDIAYATVFDVTSVEKFTTTIDSNGIYTGSLNANQITAGVIHASRIDTNSIKTSILTATNINALTLTINKGMIGGWSINSYQISKNSVALSSDGSIINGTKWRLNRDGSGQLANGAISWNAAGKFTATGGVFNNVRVNGSMRCRFVKNDSSIWIGGNTSTQEDLKNFDNVIAVRGSWNETINLSWTLEDSGRKICIVNYKWNSTITQGSMSISAPSGKYFYEDGIQKNSISFSREVIELIGYGDNRTFFGWIVINRQDIMTSSKYGSQLKYLAQGTVTASGSSVSVRSTTFDGRDVTVARSSTGRYIVYLPWNLSGKYFVMLTGLWSSEGGPRYACTDGVYGSYFYVSVQDDATRNNGGFNFIVVSNANW